MIMIEGDYEYSYISTRRKHRRRREQAMAIVANGDPLVCANCGCPHIEILQFGHFKGDGRYHRKEMGGGLGTQIISWIFQTPLDEVLSRIQLECPYCNTWHGLYGEYPSFENRPNWNHVISDGIPFEPKIRHKYTHCQKEIGEFEEE